jgi:cobalamin-dependent methionine synthase I
VAAGEGARRNVYRWTNGLPPPVPKFVVAACSKFRPDQLAKFIDWVPFFQTWDLWALPQILKTRCGRHEAVRVYAS